MGTKQDKSNLYHVMVDTDSGRRVYHPWLSVDHAEKLATLLNEIETERVERAGGSRRRGDGHFYSVIKGEQNAKRS